MASFKLRPLYYWEKLSVHTDRKMNGSNTLEWRQTHGRNIAMHRVMTTHRDMQEGAEEARITCFSTEDSLSP
jgi:hypothetical protein